MYVPFIHPSQNRCDGVSHKIGCRRDPNKNWYLDLSSMNEHL